MTEPTNPAAESLRESQLKADKAIEDVTAIIVRPDKHGLRASATAAFVALPMVLVSAALIDVMAIQAAIMPKLAEAMKGDAPKDAAPPSE
jgi:hypothetical protein